MNIFLVVCFQRHLSLWILSLLETIFRGPPIQLALLDWNWPKFNRTKPSDTSDVVPSQDDNQNEQSINSWWVLSISSHVQWTPTGKMKKMGSSTASGRAGSLCGNDPQRSILYQTNGAIKIDLAASSEGLLNDSCDGGMDADWRWEDYNFGGEP